MRIPRWERHPILCTACGKKLPMVSLTDVSEPGAWHITCKPLERAS